MMESSPDAFLPAVERREMRAVHDALARARNTTAPDILAVLTIALQAAAAEAATAPRTAPFAIAPYRIRRVKAWVHANLPGRLGLKDMAEVAGLSPFHFARCFAQEMGMTPAAYVRQQRVAYAARLITSTDLGLAEIALAAGYAHQAHPCTAFRRCTGASPGRWRTEAARLAADLGRGLGPLPSSSAAGEGRGCPPDVRATEAVHHLASSGDDQGLRVAAAQPPEQHLIA